LKYSGVSPSGDRQEALQRQNLNSLKRLVGLRPVCDQVVAALQHYILRRNNTAHRSATVKNVPRQVYASVFHGAATTPRRSDKENDMQPKTVLSVAALAFGATLVAGPALAQNYRAMLDAAPGGPGYGRAMQAPSYGGYYNYTPSYDGGLYNYAPGVDRPHRLYGYYRPHHGYSRRRY
jgi:hypothetical protein